MLPRFDGGGKAQRCTTWRLPPRCLMWRMGAADITLVDARGLRCPLPVLRAAAAARGAAAGQCFDLLADDPAAAHDVPAFARERGWSHVTSAEPNGTTRYRITI